VVQIQRGLNNLSAWYGHAGKEYIPVMLDVFPDGGYELIYFSVATRGMLWTERYRWKTAVRFRPVGLVFGIRWRRGWSMLMMMILIRGQSSRGGHRFILN
jgi:hypothetical protein